MTDYRDDLRDLAEKRGYSFDGGGSGGSGARQSVSGLAPVQQAFADWKKTPAYADLKAKIASGDLSLKEMTDSFALELTSGSLRSFIGEVLGAIGVDFIPKAISIGVMGAVDFIIGVEGSAGTVVNLDPTSPLPRVYVLVSGDLGLQEGAELDIVLGLWSTTDEGDNIDGNYDGVQLDIDDFAGVTVGAFNHHSDLALIILGADIGEDDGFEGVDAIIESFGASPPPNYQGGSASDYAYALQLSTLTCQNSENNYDEVRISYTVDGDTSTTYQLPPWNTYAMAESDKDSGHYTNWNVGQVIMFKSSVSLALKTATHNFSAITINRNSFGGGAGSSFSHTFSGSEDGTLGINKIEYDLNAVLQKA